jgi:hypothetical protein
LPGLRGGPREAARRHTGVKLLSESRMKPSRTVPSFKAEAEEAQWWHKNRARLAKDLLEAAGKGELKRLDQRTLRARLDLLSAG